MQCASEVGISYVTVQHREILLDVRAQEGGPAHGGEEPGAVGEPCEGGSGVLDCELECWADKEHLIGDGVCDDGSRGPNFFCSEFENDRGDCPETGGSDAGDDGDASDAAQRVYLAKWDCFLEGCCHPLPWRQHGGVMAC